MNPAIWSIVIAALVALTPLAHAESPLLSACAETLSPPACQAVRGDRAEGWVSQSRAEVMGTHGIVTTSQPLAAQAGLDILKKGGNAIDAAVATAAVLSVVEPMSVGIGGDLFMIVYVAKENKLYALNASGQAPSGATPKFFASLGYHADPSNSGPGSGMPEGGVLEVTVPGSLWGWEAALRRFGSMNLKQVLQPALEYADAGFPVSQRIAYSWILPPALPLRGCCTALDPDSVATWYVNGSAPKPGQLFRNPDFAKTLRILQDKGVDAFYRGAIASAIIAKVRSLGGTMTMEDLASYRGEWVDLVQTNYRGHDVFEMPPPSQAWAALENLNILEACIPAWAPGETLASLGPRNPKFWHLMIEAKKLAYADLLQYNADPEFKSVPVERLLSKSYAKTLCARVDPSKASSIAPPVNVSGAGDTVVLSTADAQGNMVSWVNSNYESFGSGITVPGYGIILHNRGALFSLAAKSPNVIAPHKRPFNTLSAGFVMDGGKPLMTLLLMGGDMQAQGHAQALVNLFDLGANLQLASDMARFHHDQTSNEVLLESELFKLVGKDLAAIGHNVHSSDGSSMGGFQAIQVHSEDVPLPGRGVSRVYRAGSDHRKDGQAVAW